MSILPGVLMTLFLWLLGGLGFGWYLEFYPGAYASTYGGLATAMVALVFLYTLGRSFFSAANSTAPSCWPNAGAPLSDAGARADRAADDVAAVIEAVGAEPPTVSSLAISPAMRYLTKPSGASPIFSILMPAG